MEKKRLTASEREALLRLNVALDILTYEPERLRERSKSVPYASRDLPMLAAKIRKLIEGYTATIPLEQLPSWKKNIKSVSYLVGVRKPGALRQNGTDFGLWLPFDTINLLLESTHDKCMMCTLDKAQRRICRLKKVIDSIPNDIPDRDDGDCPYYTLV